VSTTQLPITPYQLPSLASNAIKTAFEAYQAEFMWITGRARGRFESRDWHGAQADARERLELYPRIIQPTLLYLGSLLGQALHDRAIWARMKSHYSGLVAGRPDLELAETFFNSVTRRVFATVGVDHKIEFVDSDFQWPAAAPGEPVYAVFERRRGSGLSALVGAVLEAYAFAAPYEDAARDARLVARQIEAELALAPEAGPVQAAEVVKPVFYRGKGAYLIGRLRCAERCLPLALALRHGEQGVCVDAVLLTPPELSIIFSFTRSYFHVETQRPAELVAFLKSLLPGKRLAELYISIGYNKHGKTELYRDLLAHLAQTDDCFEPAWGEKGMVMTVFTLPSFNVVFKIIRDAFPFPKTTTRQEVMAKYQLVFKHDRAGRLIDAQEFEHLEFERSRFSPDLLRELQAVAAGSVALNGERVVIRHLYTERRVTPLNLYVRQVDAAAARDAALDYGQAIKDLAATNIFPGDLLLKNFGVTRNGRVVFYDYDELCSLSDCNFRELPRARDDDEEMSAEPWFYVGDDDIFPEEFVKFLGFPATLLPAFLDAHGDLFTADFWREMQARHRAGEIVDIYPYKANRRLVTMTDD
jgi:isocitrate dehydrogenase kinase/phosphatase